MEYEKVILDLLNRVVTLEEKVADLESSSSQLDAGTSPNKKDTTKYQFEGRMYGKSRLVHAIVQSYLRKNPNIHVADLVAAFDKSLQGSLGVVRDLEEVKRNVSDYSKRFFTRPEEVLTLQDGLCVVCTQWKIDNIENFLTRANQLDFIIRETV